MKNNKPNGIIYILVALIVGILIGTYVPKIIQNQTANSGTSKVLNSLKNSNKDAYSSENILNQFFQNINPNDTSASKKKALLCNTTKCNGNGACYIWMGAGNVLQAGANQPTITPYIVGTQNGEGLCYF